MNDEIINDGSIDKKQVDMSIVFGKLSGDLMSIGHRVGTRRNPKCTVHYVVNGGDLEVTPGSTINAGPRVVHICNSKWTFPKQYAKPLNFFTENLEAVYVLENPTYRWIGPTKFSLCKTCEKKMKSVIRKLDE